MLVAQGDDHMIRTALFRPLSALLPVLGPGFKTNMHRPAGERPVNHRAPPRHVLEKIKLAGTAAEDMTDLFYATKNGAFARGGLAVVTVSTSSGAAATTAVIGGTYPIARTSLIALLSAHLRGIPLVIV